jgi:primosomal protein N' (replication factor Y)
VWDVLQRLSRIGVVELDVVPPSLGPAPARERVVVLTRALPSLLERDRVFGRAKRQRDAYETMDSLGGEAGLSRLTGDFGFSKSVIDGLVARGVARVEEREAVRDPFQDLSVPPPSTPSAPQVNAIDTIARAPAGSAISLFGVTGSGKTLVYLEAMRRELAAGRGAIILVPEIALTPQTIARVRGVFGNEVAVLHSGLSDGERADAWRTLAAGRRRVAVGARSAVFAPVRDVSLIVVDEEHDASYKNGEQPRYHARDVAQRRARLEGARAVLGSATPSLEVWAARERIAVVSLPQRVEARPLPPVQLVDMRSAPRVAHSGAVPWSALLDQEVAARLELRQQVILLLNRRGFAHVLQCDTCGEAEECPSCSIALTVHRTPEALRCHYCGHERAIPERCGTCGGAQQRMRGVGTQSLERWLTERFPTARLARMDADTTATKWSHARILDEFARGDIDILLGTQMIAKGLDFPGVTLVGVVNADTGLHLPDFRAAERTFQLVAQVAGRAGRGPDGGSVLIQTRVPTHYALQAAGAHDVAGFADRELAERRDPPYPPHVGLVRVIVSGDNEQEVGSAAARVADWLVGLTTTRSLPIQVLGPAPAPLARIKKRWRWHVLLRSDQPATLGRVVRFAASRAPHTGSGRIRVVFDRDPVSLL